MRQNGRAMLHRLEVVLGEKVLDQRLVADVALDGREVRMLKFSFLQIEDDAFASRLEKAPRQQRTEETGTTGYEHTARMSGRFWGGGLHESCPLS